MSEDFKWFKENYPEFQERYGNSFLAIKNKRVLGVYPTYSEGVQETMKTEELGTFIVQECNQSYEAYCGYIAHVRAEYIPCRYNSSKRSIDFRIESD